MSGIVVLGQHTMAFKKPFKDQQLKQMKPEVIIIHQAVGVADVKFEGFSLEVVYDKSEKDFKG
jgi:hypothetical protein